MIKEIKEKYFLHNLIYTRRYSGQLLIKDETVSDHVTMMNALAIAIVPIINKRIEVENESQGVSISPIDLENVVYRIVVHDLDENVTFDIPRPFKYNNEILTEAIYNTTQTLLRQAMSQEMVDDINNAKGHDTREGYFVATLDTLQAGLKMQSELELGNHRFKSELPNVIEVLELRLQDLIDKKYQYDIVFDKSMRELLQDYLIEFKKLL